MSPYITLFMKGIKLFFILPFALSSKSIMSVRLTRIFLTFVCNGFYTKVNSWALVTRT